ncbi:MAG TPA: type II secretion system protein [Verrucomicrobiae bacterium]|nr:type II secretion system protein [Verrucomicrobiae bacterium]
MTHGQESMRCSRAFSCRPGRETAFREDAFSLIELLAVVAILLILTTLYWRGNRGSRSKEQEAACAQNLEKLFIALDIYANEHSGRFPQKTGATTSAQALDLLVPKYSADTSLFICPGSKDAPLPSAESIASRQISYAYYMGREGRDAQTALMTDRQVDTKSKAQGQPLFSSTGQPPGNNHQNLGGNILFTDGHVDASGPTAGISLVFTQGVVLLNP